MKNIGKPCARKSHARFDEGGQAEACPLLYRELLGEMLLELGRPAQAFAEFERSLKRDPNRFRSIYGAARAAEASGNRKEARDYYARLRSLPADHDSARDALTQARAFLGEQ